MKKYALAIAVLTIAMISCQNDNSINPRPLDQIVSAATITGRLKVDLSTDPGEDNVPAGLPVIAEISTKSFVLDPVSNVTYAKKYYYATTNAAGEYTLNVEAGPTGSEVIVHLPAFYANAIISGASYSIPFRADPYTIQIQKGQAKISDYTYTF